jgi:hypothetical protein
MATEPVLPDSVLRSICEVLGQTHGGLTNAEIGRLLAEAGVHDPTPRVTQVTYVAMSKRDRLHRALAEDQSRMGRSNRVLRFIKVALAPMRFHDASGQFETLRPKSMCRPRSSAFVSSRTARRARQESIHADRGEATGNAAA